MIEGWEKGLMGMWYSPCQFTDQCCPADCRDDKTAVSYHQHHTMMHDATGGFEPTLSHTLQQTASNMVGARLAC